MLNQNMSNQDYKIYIASLPEKENCVCEILYKNVTWIEISKETDEVILQVYGNPFRNEWTLNLEESLLMLEAARMEYATYIKMREEEIE